MKLETGRHGLEGLSNGGEIRFRDKIPQDLKMEFDMLSFQLKSSLLIANETDFVELSKLVSDYDRRIDEYVSKVRALNMEPTLDPDFVKLCDDFDALHEIFEQRGNQR
jgi:hypothetical protein